MPASILLVDDDPLLVQLMGAMLADLGRVRFATDGEAALRQLGAERPDLILLDVQMPRMDGFAVCRSIKTSGELDDIPIIFVTAESDEDFEVRCFDAGAADFIHKPVSRPILRARVQTQLRLKQALDTVRRMALSDALTGLTNRRAFDGLLSREFRQAQRDGTPLGMLMVDVDRFKDYNDCYGHAAGDACLAAVAHALQDGLLRPYDTVARYGGEEFAVLLPGIGADGMRVVAERLLAAVAALRIPHRRGAVDDRVSVSLGGAIHRPAAAPENAVDGAHATGAIPGTASLADRADRALYAAKRQGRARFCMADDFPA